MQHTGVQHSPPALLSLFSPPPLSPLLPSLRVSLSSSSSLRPRLKHPEAHVVRRGRLVRKRPAPLPE
eukprot:1866735-Rhodomonas_salina.1